MAGWDRLWDAHSDFGHVGGSTAKSVGAGDNDCFFLLRCWLRLALIRLSNPRGRLLRWISTGFFQRGRRPARRTGGQSRHYRQRRSRRPKEPRRPNQNRPASTCRTSMAKRLHNQNYRLTAWLAFFVARLPGRLCWMTLKTNLRRMGEFRLHQSCDKAVTPPQNAVS